MVFTEKEINMMQDCGSLVKEFLVEQRKGVPQTQYVVNLTAGKYWDVEKDDMEEVPESMLGLWMQKYPRDNTWYGWQHSESLSGDWVRCEKKEVVAYEYVEILSKTLETDIPDEFLLNGGRQ